MKAKNPALFTSIGLTVALAGSASAALLLSDNFTVTGTTNTNNLNYNLARQTGTQTTETWTGAGNAQVGNPSVFGGDGNYLMVADGAASARLASLSLSSALVAANEKLVIKFDADATGGTDNWMSFMISPSSIYGLYHPVVGTGDFGMLIRNDGHMQAFNNGAVFSGINDVLTDSAGINTITLTFSGSDGTGSPFAGNGTRVNIFDGTNSWNATLNTGFTSETISFGNAATGGRSYVDNLSIYTIPEPGTALLGGLGLLALLRRRRA